jgi:hypothetical protein
LSAGQNWFQGGVECSYHVLGLFGEKGHEASAIALYILFDKAHLEVEQDLGVWEKGSLWIKS